MLDHFVKQDCDSLNHLLDMIREALMEIEPLYNSENLLLAGVSKFFKHIKAVEQNSREYCPDRFLRIIKLNNDLESKFGTYGVSVFHDHFPDNVLLNQIGVYLRENDGKLLPENILSLREYADVPLYKLLPFVENNQEYFDEVYQKMSSVYNAIYQDQLECMKAIRSDEIRHLIGLMQFCGSNIFKQYQCFRKYKDSLLGFSDSETDSSEVVEQLAESLYTLLEVSTSDSVDKPRWGNSEDLGCEQAYGSPILVKKKSLTVDNQIEQQQETHDLVLNRRFKN